MKLLKNQVDKIRHIVFVCTGNVCRSPMAEYLCRHFLAGDPLWQVSSAGVFALPGAPASLEAVDALREMSVDLSPHRSRSLSRELIDSATMIVVMTQAHADEIKLRFPDVQDRVHTLKAFDKNATERDIQDPIGGSLETYRLTRDEIESALLGLLAYLKSSYRRDGKR